MNFYLSRFLRNKSRYLAMMLIIGCVYFAMHILFMQLPDLYKEFNPVYTFNIENVYELRTMTSSHSLLGIDDNVGAEIKFNDDLVNDLENIEGINSVCLCDVFEPMSEIYGCISLNDSIQNFILYGLGEGFEDVLKLKITKNDNRFSTNPEIYIESTLAERLNEAGFRGNKIEVGEEKNRYDINGTFNPLGINARRKGELFAGIQKIKESGRILFRLIPGTDIKDVENSIYRLLTTRYNADKNAFSYGPLFLSGKEDWFENKNQVVAMFIIAIICLLYIMLSLLGLYWNETKNRNVEIGIMRAIGFTKWQVFGMVIKEATIISVVAIIISVILIINSFPKDLESTRTFILSIFVNSAILLGIVWLSVIIPAVKSSMVEPAQALSEE
ncbi:MAG TPA: FtsX-like permease family protein [Bacteroidales bacterium]|nr:FtsX-like permease family protein [Bacteroidales bacterium]